MTLHIEEICLKKIKKSISHSKDLFRLAEINYYVKGKAEEYARENNVKKAGEYFILSYRINERMEELIKDGSCFR